MQRPPAEPPPQTKEIGPLTEEQPQKPIHEPIQSNPLGGGLYSATLNRHLTKEEIRKMRVVGELHLALNHEGKQGMKRLVSRGHLLENELTSADIDLYYEVKPPCIGCIQALMKQPPNDPFPIPTGSLTGQYWELDIMFLGETITMILAECITNLVWQHALASRSARAVKSAVESWDNFLKKVFPRAYASGTITIRSDREKVFTLFEIGIPAVRLSRTSAEGHANRAEAMIKKIKMKFKATILSLPYTLPSKLYSDLIVHTVRVINCMPHPREDQAESPREMVYRKKIKLDELTRCKFGDMGYTVVPKDHRSKQYERAPGAAVPVIVVGFEDGTPSNLYLFDPETGGKPTRSKFVVSPDNKDIIKIMNDLAKENPILHPSVIQEISTDILEDDTTEPTKDILSALVGDQAIDDNSMTIRQAADKYGDQAVRQSVIAEINNMINMGVFDVINVK